MIALLFGTFDENLDPLALLDVCERLLRVLEADFPCDKLFDTDTFARNKIDSGLVVAGAIAEGTFDVKLLSAHGHDGEVNVGLAHAALVSSLAVPETKQT